MNKLFAVSGAIVTLLLVDACAKDKTPEPAQQTAVVATPPAAPSACTPPTKMAATPEDLRPQ